MSNRKNDIKNAIEKIFYSRKNRITHPRGKFDNGNRFYPAYKNEQLICCSCIREPSRGFPFSFLHHCRTKKHVAALINKLGPYSKVIMIELAIIRRHKTMKGN